MIAKFLNIMRSNKKITYFVIFLIIIGLYSHYKATKDNKDGVNYVTSEVKKGMITSSVSGSGQVSVSDQVDIKSKVSGDVLYVGVEAGQEVKLGTLLLRIDTSDAEKSVRNAETSLETAKLELDELLASPDELEVLKAENDLIQTEESKENAKDDIEKAYEDGFNSVSNAFLDLPGVITGFKNVIFEDDFIPDLSNINYYANTVRGYDDKTLEYRDDAYDDYQTAKEKYDQNFQSYKEASRYSDAAVIENLIDQTYDTTKALAEAIKSMNDLINFYKDILTDNDLESSIPQFVSIHQDTLDSYTGTVNNHLSSLLSIRSNIKDSKESLVNIERDIEEKTESLSELKAGADELDIRAKKIAIQQQEDALTDARQNLANHYIRAPFDGVIAEIDVKKGESISSGSTLVTFISKQKIVEITVNEIDVALIKTGQKVNVTFDAIEDLTVTGQVVEIDTLGTVSQGVVTYDVKIVLDVQDERIKPGMSISANIITNLKQDVLMIPNSAVKYQGDLQYVEIMLDDNSVKSQQVEIGISNDTMTEIISGLEEGDKVVTQTVSSGSTSSSENSGGRGAGGGMMMFR
jgi:HlyD family secretion protein